MIYDGKKIMFFHLELRRGAKWFDLPFLAVLLGEEIPIFHGTLEELAVLGQLWFQHCGLWKYAGNMLGSRSRSSWELTNPETRILLELLQKQ